MSVYIEVPSRPGICENCDEPEAEHACYCPSAVREMGEEAERRVRREERERCAGVVERMVVEANARGVFLQPADVVAAIRALPEETC